MLLLALCAGAAVEYSGRCVAAPAPPPSGRDAKERARSTSKWTRRSGQSALVRGSIWKPDLTTQVLDQLREHLAGIV
jgi:hypothetical protein